MQYSLRMHRIDKSFPGVHALDRVSFDVEAGTVHALVGENGAGKSTLMKVISGSYLPDSGTMEVFGTEQTFRSPAEAQRSGISMIHQELEVVPERSVASNVFLGREPRKLGGLFIDREELNARTQELLDRLDVAVRPQDVVSHLSIAQQQMVEVAKALSYNARIIIMDEPTSSLTERETATLFRTIKELRSTGITVIYISHRMEEIFEIADRVTVLRDGQTIRTDETKNLDADVIVRSMVGRTIADIFPKRTVSIGEVVLEVEDLSGGRFSGVSFDLRAGEIIGVSGLVGAGRSEMVKGLLGIDPITSGRIRVGGEEISSPKIDDMMRRGFAFVPEDRKMEALFLGMSVRDNLGISVLRRLFRSGLLRLRRLEEMVRGYIERLRIQTPGSAQIIRNLSGGNQQKVIIARCLALAPSVLILDEPTRGIDVGAKAEIHSIIGDLAAKGVGIIMISSELPEILGVSDRVLVMKEGRLVTVMDRSEATEDAIMQSAATGGATA